MKSCFSFRLLFLAITNVILVSAWLSLPLPHAKIHSQPLWRTRQELYAIAEQQLGSFEALLLDPKHRRVACESYLDDDELMSFEDAWRRQRSLLEQHVDRIKQDPSSNSFLLSETGTHSKSSGYDRVLLLEHSPVYTLGTGSDERFILQKQSTLTESSELKSNENKNASEAAAVAIEPHLPIPVIRMDRGGEVTYHGPGQLVVYPILDLRHYRQDIHWYMRALEEVVLVACRQLPLSYAATRQADTTGIWIDNHKIAAMGIKCSRWITQHGLAVNVDEASLSGFDGIVPCGLEGRQVGCLNQFLDQPVTVREFAVLLREAMEEVFCIQLVDVSRLGE